MMSIKQIIILLLVLYCLLLLFMYMQQHNFLFFPNSAQHRNQASEDMEDYSLNNNGIALRGWLVAPDNVTSNLLIYYGGNAEDIFYTTTEFKGYNGFASLLVNYRGYGSSEGQPSEQALFDDALAVFDDITTRHAPKRVFLMGRSLGSGVAVHVAAKRKVSGIILVTPYDSIVNIARRHYPYLPVSLLLKHKFRSIDYAADINCRALVIHGGKDNVIPKRNTLKLIATLEQKEVVFIDKAGHNDIESYPEYSTAISSFLTENQ